MQEFGFPDKFMLNVGADFWFPIVASVRWEQPSLLKYYVDAGTPCFGVGLNSVDIVICLDCGKVCGILNCMFGVYIVVAVVVECRN